MVRKGKEKRWESSVIPYSAVSERESRLASEPFGMLWKYKYFNAPPSGIET